MLKRSEVESDNNDSKDSTVSSETAGTAPQNPGEALLSVDKLQEQLAETSKEIAELKDKYLRVLADAENARKRIRQQSEESVRLQRENILRDLLPIMDNLERALEAARGGGNGQAHRRWRRDGAAFADRLPARAGVTPVHAVGQTFDPRSA